MSKILKIKVLAPVVLILILAVFVGGRFVGTSGQPERAEIALEANALETQPAGMSTEEEAAAGDPAPSVDIGREAAAGPQLEETDFVVVAPVPTQKPSPPVNRIGIQAGHWKTAELPDELARLRNSTGTTGGGVAEWELNLDIAKRVAPLLEAKGLKVDVLPSTIPPGYKADAFVALHADGDVSSVMSGFKLASARTSTVPGADGALLKAISEEYRVATNLRIDPSVSRNMTGYYAFPFRRFQHSIAPSTPGVILEMGFLTNASDRTVLLGRRDAVAQGIANGILRFLAPRADESALK